MHVLEYVFQVLKEEQLIRSFHLRDDSSRIVVTTDERRYELGYEEALEFADRVIRQGCA